MTISLLRSFCLALLFAASALEAAADEASEPIQVTVGGRTYASFEAYKRSGIPGERKGAGDVPAGVPEPLPGDVLGIAMPLGQVRRDFEHSAALASPVGTQADLEKAIERAVDGKEGPLLFLTDDNRVRVMGLKALNSPDDNPGTKP